MTRWNPQPAIERVWPRIQVGVCWLWTGSLTTAGYGQVRSSEGPLVSVHRLVYETLVGPIPDGLELDHLCRVRHCCDPDHLEPVTPGENHRRGSQVLTHCKNGHPFDSTAGNQRTCRICRRAAWHRWKARQTT